MLKVSSHTKYKCETRQRIEFFVDKFHHYVTEVDPADINA